MTPDEDDDSNDLMTHQISSALFDRGLNSAFTDGEVIEFEFDRPNPPGAFPSRYCIFGLRVMEEGIVHYSIEPMFKPEKGDPYEESFVSDAEKREVRAKIERVLKEKVMPVLQAKGLRLGVEVDNIHSEDPTPISSEGNAAPLPQRATASKGGRKNPFRR